MLRANLSEITVVAKPQSGPDGDIISFDYPTGHENDRFFVVKAKKSVMIMKDCTVEFSIELYTVPDIFDLYHRHDMHGNLEQTRESEGGRIYSIMETKTSFVLVSGQVWRKLSEYINPCIGYEHVEVRDEVLELEPPSAPRHTSVSLGIRYYALANGDVFPEGWVLSPVQGTGGPAGYYDVEPRKAASWDVGQSRIYPSVKAADAAALIANMNTAEGWHVFMSR